MQQHQPSEETHHASRRALVIAVQQPGESDEELHSSLVELERLANTLGIGVVSQEIQKRRKPSSDTFVGSGKLDQLARLTGGSGVVSAREDDQPDNQPETNRESGERPVADVALVDAELKPRQHRSLELALGVDVFDRTSLILQIFEKRAQTRAARLEVEIARLQYELPRLRDDGSGDDRRGGGGRGERGHTNVELGKERIRDRIAELKRELDAEQETAESRRERRQQAFQVVLVGYTNAGKSSLLQALTDSEVLVEDQLFATLGTTVRRLQPSTTPPILVSDTVGFIKYLPHELVASFRSTLDEAMDAQLILLVVDVSDPDWRDQLQVTRETLSSIGASSIATRLVFNKVDRIDGELRRRLQREFPRARQMSAFEPDDISALREELIEVHDMGLCEESIFIPFDDGHLLGEIYEQARVVEEKHDDRGRVLRLRARAASIDRWRSKLDDPPPVESVDDLLEAAQRHGLELITEHEQFDDSGLDFRVLHALDEDGEDWILRAPRRPDVYDASRVEGRVLRLVKSRLPVETPDWQLHTARVIAYPLVPGTPGWSIDDDGMEWNGIDPGGLSDSFLSSVAETLVALQAIDVNDVRSAGVPVKTLDEIRRDRRRLMNETRDVLQPDDALWEFWSRWLDDTEIWPTHTALVHGDFHPGHMLFDEKGSLTGVLDWTEAEVGDPGRELAIFYGCFGESGLTRFLEYFASAGGRTWPGIAEYVARCWAFHPVEAAAWALEHDDDAVLSHARAQLAQVNTEPSSG